MEIKSGLVKLKSKIQNYLESMSMDDLLEYYSPETDERYESFELYLKPYDILIVNKNNDNAVNICEVTISQHCYYKDEDILSYQDDNLLKFFSKTDIHIKQQHETQVNQIANNILEEINKYEQQGDVE